MNKENKSALVDAAHLLRRSDDAIDLYDMLTVAAPLVARFPLLRFVNDAEPLNALAKLKIGEPETYADIIALVERHRAEANLPALAQADGGKFDKAAYMQQFMEQKRLRQRRAAELENMQRSERDKLIGRARMDFMQRQSEIWKHERDAFIAKVREAALPDRLTKEQSQVALNQFWDKVDRQLDELEAKVATKGVIKNATAMADLDAILRYDPYKRPEVQ